MATKIRLILDLGIQFLVFLLFAWQILAAPSEARWTVGLFAVSISAWQILHALYVVRKYQDWAQRRYLLNIKQLIAYAFFSLLIGGLMLVASFGHLYEFTVFALEVLYWIICGVIGVLAVLYFVHSARNLYIYYHRPRSFWDL